MGDVISAVETAQAEYEARHKRKGKLGEWKGKTRDYLMAFSKRVAYYGPIMDTLVSSNPEYAALAWGAMKFLFIVSPASFLPVDAVTHQFSGRAFRTDVSIPYNTADYIFLYRVY